MDKVAVIFVPIVIGIAVLSAIVWWIFGGEHAFTQGLLANVTVLVIACPCALGLPTPTAIMAGMGKGAENGILIKDAESLERARNITAIVLDRTGTITEGKPDVIEAMGLDEHEVASALLVIEPRSTHPLAEATRKMGLPRFGLGVEYMVMDKNSPMMMPGMSGSEIMPMVSLSLPIHRNKYRSAVEEARSLEQAVLGAAMGDDVVIASGLEAGEEIVVHGTFTVDAAAQLSGAPSMMSPQGGAMPAGHDHGRM